MRRRTGGHWTSERNGIAAAALPLALAIALSACGNDSQTSDDAVATFTPLGVPAGYASSTAASTSSDGRVVVGTAVSAAGTRQAFRWTAPQGIVGIGFLPGGTSSTGKDVSSNGQVIVGDADGGITPALHAFRWTVDLGLVELPPLKGASICAAGGVSGDGGVVAGTCLTTNGEAFRWTEAGSAGLGQFGPGSNATSSATAVSVDGRVIGGAGHPVLVGAMIWDASNTPTVIGTLPGMVEGAATALSRDGAVVVGVATDGDLRPHAFRWSAATGIAPLASAGFQATYASGTSGDARRIVGWGTASEIDTAIIWDETGNVHRVMDLLSPNDRAAATGWRLSRARGISEDGRYVVGEGVDPSGATEAWLVTLPD